MTGCGIRSWMGSGCGSGWRRSARSLFVALHAFGPGLRRGLPTNAPKITGFMRKAATALTKLLLHTLGVGVRSVSRQSGVMPPLKPESTCASKGSYGKPKTRTPFHSASRSLHAQTAAKST
jgi:hypothetical protein